ncbi:MAG: CDP-glycerol glycerophosphotransferase family protein [Candidatus Cloacimonetes bacterium]|nr:CDP-glycerol glycerophosphotransferase family protein [Candidatus Cloacimonadota bacterium]
MTKFLFFVEREFHIELFRNLIAYISENSLGEIGILTFEFQELQDSGKTVGARTEVLRKNVSAEYTIVTEPYEYAPDITFVCDSSYEKVEGLGKIVSIGHGTICKGSFYTDTLLMRRENCADLICVPGKVHRQKLEKNVYRPIAVTGIPKLDKIFSAKYDKLKILSEMKLNPHHKTILFAPTFNPELSLIPFMEFDLRKYIPSYFNIIIKLHGVAQSDWAKKYRQLAADSTDIYFHEGYDVDSCFAAADLLLSDVSSVIYEFAALGKPVVLFDSPLQKKLPKYNPDDLEYRYRSIGRTFSKMEELPQILWQELSGSFKPKNDIIDSFISERDGSSSEKVIEAALKTLSVSRESLVYFTKGIHFSAKKLYQGRFELSDNIERMFDSDMEFIIIADSDCNYAPHTFTLMLTHLKFNREIDIITIPVSNSYKDKGQQITDYLLEAKVVSDKRIAMSISYLYSGNVSDIKQFDPVCFAFRRELLQDATFCRLLQEKNYTSMSEQGDLTIRIALDCFAF